MHLIVETFQWWTDNPERMRAAIDTHVKLSLTSLAFAVVIGILLGVLAGRTGGPLGFVIVQIANLGRVVPSLAILALALPLVGVGFRPAVIALVAVGVQPILVNAYTGISAVNASVREAARGQGMTEAQLLRSVELPLAFPLMLAGIRTSAVQIVSTSTLAALIGGGGLGEIVFNGIAVIDDRIILAGAIPIAILALAAEAIVALIQRYATPRGLRHV
jgi:osmoprotectant transport system permease protein